MKLEIRLYRAGSAQGRYVVKAKGSIIAILSWADTCGRLSGWSPFAYVPVDPYGNGLFCFKGNRGIPAGATHVHMRCVASDFSRSEEMLTEIPKQFIPLPAEEKNWEEFTVLSDMHLVSKTWRIRRALQMAECDAVFLVGDLVNDGTTEQFSELIKCIDDAAGEKAVFPVIGNHDIIHPAYSGNESGIRNYAAFHDFMMDKLRQRGIRLDSNRDDMAYAAALGNIDVIGIQCVISGRKFLFPEGRQLDWLEKQLEIRKDAAWRLILCHAPLLAHNPNRNEGNPYLDRNRRLQEIIEHSGNIIFVSGHTHISPNVEGGCVEYDSERNIIYLNGGSVVTTSMGNESGLMDPGWADGCVSRIRISDTEIEIGMRSVTDGSWFPRGYYRFQRMKGR